MTNALKLDTANLVGILMQAIFYGVFQVLFVACIYVLIYSRTTASVNWHFLITACLMWVLIGVHFALSWSRVMDAFIVLQPALQDDPQVIIKYFGNIGHWKVVTRTGVYVGLTAIADSFFIYRCYIVWGRAKFVIIVPVILLCGSITAGIGVELVLWKAGTVTDLFGNSLAPWVLSFFSISLVLNVLATGFTVYRVWLVNVGVSHMIGARSLWPVIIVVLESAALYSSTLIALLITYASGSFAQYIALDMLVPIIGIVFNLIIVRVGLGLTETSNGGEIVPSDSAMRFPLQKLSITIERHITVEANETIDDASATVEPGRKSSVEV